MTTTLIISNPTIFYSFLGIGLLSLILSRIPNPKWQNTKLCSALDIIFSLMAVSLIIYMFFGNDEGGFKITIEKLRKL